MLFLLLLTLVNKQELFGQEACNANINISLDENCRAELLHTAVLENPLEKEYYVLIGYPDDGQTINEVVKYGTYRYLVYAKIGGQDYIYQNDQKRASFSGDVMPDEEVCWGYVHAEDKRPPFACIRKVVGLYKRSVDDYTNADYFLANRDAKEIDGAYHVYDPVTCDDEVCNDAIFNRSYLNDPHTNLLICTDVDSIFNVEQSYLDKKYAYYTGFPELKDNCEVQPSVITAVKDNLVDYECTYKYDDCMKRLIAAVIYRTFYFEDEFGNRGEITQEICFYKPLVYLPNCKEILDLCLYGDIDPENSETDLAPAAIHSIPYYKNGACMTMYLDGHACNTTAVFEDLVLPGPEKCGFKVVRTWTLLDWCWNPAIYFPDTFSEPIPLLGSDFSDCAVPAFSDWKNKSFTFEQHLIVGDDEDPVVVCSEYSYNGSIGPFTTSVGPFSCEAGFEVPAPKVTNKECAYTWTVEVWTYVPILWQGVPTGEYELVKFAGAEIITDVDKDKWITKRVNVAGVPKGRHYLMYKVEDHCGNTAYSTHCEFYVIDEIEPVAVCDDDLTVSIVSSPSGAARVYATEVDEGSWDNCSEILLKVRRFVPEACVADFKAGSAQVLETKAVTIDKPGTLAHGKKGYWTVWAEYVDFVCCDIGVYPETGKVLVELGVWDNEDNFNTCWLEVLTEDKIAPTCVAPHDIYLSCEEVPYYASLPETNVKWADLSTTEQDNIKRWFGEISEPAIGWDNCDVTVEMIDVKFDIHCKAGVITRQFQATDAWGRKSPVCEQKIYLSRFHDYCIKFPEDAEAECLTDPEIPGVELFEYACDLLAVSTQDEYFFVPTSNEECYKLFRTYRVINWCQFDEEVDPDTPLFDRFDTYFNIEPLVVSRDEDENGFPGDEAVYVRYSGNEDSGTGITWIDDDCDRENVGFRNTAFEKGFYQYTQVVKVFDQVAPMITIVGDYQFPSYAIVDEGNKNRVFRNGLPMVCTGGVSLTVEISETCTPAVAKMDKIYLFPDRELGIGTILLYANAQVTNDGQAFGFSIENNGTVFTLNGNFPIGSHELEIHIEDGCGNADADVIPFEVYDAKGPAPVCISGLSVNLTSNAQGNSEMMVWASDFIASEAWDCSGPARFTIHRSEEVDDLLAAGGELIPDFDANASILVTCDDPAILTVYLYAWDNNGNGDRCEALILVNNYRNLCDQSSKARIAGQIMTEEQKAVSGVSVLLSGQTTGNATTALDGNYQFSNLTAGNDYTIKPQLDNDHQNGVSTFDLVIISKHILGVLPLDSPYKMIAADVNNSYSISTLDIIQLRKLILSIDIEFSNNSSWRFIDANFKFRDITNPWLTPFPEVINYNDLLAGQWVGNFIAVKIGDVTGDALVNDQILKTRLAGAVFDIQVKTEKLRAGELRQIPFYAPGMEDVDGYQFTLKLSPKVKLEKIEYGSAKAENFGWTYLENGYITISWNKTGSVGNQSLGHLFSLTLQALEAIELNEALEINSRYTRAEAYGKDGQFLIPQIQFTDSDNTFMLSQNMPNPFQHETKIRFNLPQPASASLTVFDVTGTIRYHLENNFNAGWNEILLNKEALNLPNGILYYSLATKDFKAIKTMIVIN